MNKTFILVHEHNGKRNVLYKLVSREESLKHKTWLFGASDTRFILATKGESFFYWLKNKVINSRRERRIF